MFRLARIALITVAVGGGAGAQAPPSPPGNARAEAYEEYLRARRFEREGNLEGAARAYARVAELDPAAAEPRASLAALYAAQNRVRDAVAAAQEALALDGGNEEAHWVLGMVYAAVAETPGGAGGISPDEATTRAIEHLERVLPDRGYDLRVPFSLGRLYLRIHQYDKAIDRLGELVDEQPGFSRAALLLAEAYQGADREAEAIATLERAVQIDPQFSQGLVTLAELYERRGQWTDAADAYGRAAVMSPRALQWRLRQATALARAGESEPALELLRGLADEHPSEAAVLYALADTERQAGDLDSAETTARRLLELEPQGLRGPLVLAQILERRRDHRGVVEVLTPAIGRAAGSADRPGRDATRMTLLLHLAFAHQALGEHDQAIARFTEARSLAHGDPSVTVYLAQAQIDAGRAEEASAMLAEARRQHPRHGGLLRTQARALQEAGEGSAAVALLSDALTGTSGELATYVALAELYTAQRSLGEAEAILVRATERYEADPLGHFQLGAVYEQQQKLELAENAFRRAIELDPGHAPSLNYLGYMFADRGERLNEAVSLLERAVELDPFNGSYLDSLGWAYYRLERFDLARDYLTRAASQLERNSVVQDHLGDTLSSLGDRAGAVAAWERALAGDGEDIERDVIADKIRRAREGPQPRE